MPYFKVIMAVRVSLPVPATYAPDKMTLMAGTLFGRHDNAVNGRARWDAAAEPSGGATA
jgi:hypothetical protein